MSDRYQELKKQYIKGWRTWNVRSVLSHVHMPDGFALNVAFKEYREGHYLKETLIGRFTNEYGREPAETAFPGVHAFDGSYTEMTVEWCDMQIKVESAIEDERFVILVTPIKKQIKPAMLVLEGGFLWGREGWVEKKENSLESLPQQQRKRNGRDRCGVCREAEARQRRSYVRRPGRRENMLCARYGARPRPGCACFQPHIHHRQ